MFPLLAAALLALGAPRRVAAVDMSVLLCDPSVQLSSPNLIPNGGFEGGMAPWSFGNGPSFSSWSSGSFAHSGTGYMALGSVGYLTNINSGTLVGDPSQRYYLTFWSRVAPTDSPVAMSFAIDGQQIGPYIDSVGGLGDAGWKRFCLPVTAPVTANSQLTISERDDPSYL